MPKGTDEAIEFGRVGRRVVQAACDGGSVLLRQVDDPIDLTRMARAALGDNRRRASVRRDMHSLRTQRVYGLC